MQYINGIISIRGDNMENKFYVYEFIRLDTMEPFYIGKGCGNRVNDKHRGRSEWFKNIIKRHGAVSRIVVDNLSEKEAYEAEVWFIYEYKHILNYNLVNLDDGGFGANQGESNPMYGKRGELSPIYGRKASESRKLNISKALKGKNKSKEHIENLKKAYQSRDTRGAKNPNYGNGEKISGGKNPAALQVGVINTKGEVKVFETKTHACDYFGLSPYLLNKLLGKTISVERDFNREKEKYNHIDGYKFTLINEGVTTS